MPEFLNAPIHRHEALQPLSRDHYVGLVQAQRLKRAAEGDDVARRAALAAFVDAWDQEISAHFADEERLLPALLTQADAERLRREHQQLRTLADQARSLRKQTDPDAQTLRQLGEQLEQHIRWEERELFGRLQEGASAKQMTDLLGETKLIEQQRPRSACRET